MIQSCIIHFDDGSKAIFKGEPVFVVGDKRKVVKIQFSELAYLPKGKELSLENLKPYPDKIKSAKVK